MSSMNKDLSHQRDMILRMAQCATRSVEITKKLFTTSDLSVRKQVWEEVNTISKVLDTFREDVIAEILSFMIRYQPLGKELRITKTLINVTYDIYRISRYCREISRVDSMLAPENGVSVISELINIFDDVLRALNAAFEDLRELSVAREDIVKEIDNKVDTEYMKILKEITSLPIVNREKAIKALLMRHVERIVDHAYYIENYVKELQQ